MKKLFAVIMTLVMLPGCVGLTAFAEGQPLTANVYVTIANKGNFVVTQEKITVTDKDNSGTLTIDEALYATHEAKYEGGAEAGYATAVTSWGLSITELWGNDSGNFGYFENNASAISLADTVNEGDCLNAFIYSDSEYYSDTYCWYDITSVSADTNEEISLKLSGAGYDSGGNPIVLPVEGATITVNGEKTAFKTDKDGKVTFTVDKEGSYIISAVSDTQVLVPPVCKATVTAATVTPPANNTSDTNNNTNVSHTNTSNNTVTSPKTGDNSNMIFFVVIMVVSAGALVTLSVMRKMFYEK